MNIPERYINIVNYFQGLQVAGELMNEHKISILKKKFESSILFNVRTSLEMGKENLFSVRESYFNMGIFGEQSYFYFPFSVTLNRNKDEVIISTFLTTIIVTEKNTQPVFTSKNQIEKMYKNGFLYNLKSQGFQDIQLSRTFKGFELKTRLDENQNHEDVIKLYEKIKKMCTDSLKAI